MAKRYFAKKGEPTVKEIEAAIELTLANIMDQSSQNILNLFEAFTPERVIEATVNVTTQRTFLRFPCGDGNRWFSAEHGERHMKTEIQNHIASHGFQGKNKPPKCSCNQRPVRITQERSELVQHIPGQREKVMAELAQTNTRGR